MEPRAPHRRGHGRASDGGPARRGGARRGAPALPCRAVPGPGHPADPRDFAVGRDVLLAGVRPVLGVCLGMQGLVTTYGGTVGRVPPAHGDVAAVTHDGRGVFAGLPQGFEAVRYHSLAALVVPDCLEVSATCVGQRDDDPHVVMGVRHRELPLEGVQFHPESILSQHGAALVSNFVRRR
ncbi:MAG: aminodeoxychorismate/anthranilate synthase component II [Nocardioides sp.]